LSFSIEITEVGPAEFPLLEVLRDTVFGEFGHVSHATVAEGIEGKDDLLILLAHLEGNPVGFSAGYRRTLHAFYINYMAILREYRRQGIGRQFMAREESFARARGYERIEFNTQNRYRGMMLLGLDLGYRPVALEQDDGTENDLVIRFAKSLQHEATKDERLLRAVGAGDEIAGLIRETSGALKTILRSEAP
jgi:GNAT superfamily N-acetyltransferase